MIRKSRLVKVTFGCCAVIFLILQFLDHSTEPKDAPIVEPVNPSGHPLQQPLANHIKNQVLAYIINRGSFAAAVLVKI